MIQCTGCKAVIRNVRPGEPLEGALYTVMLLNASRKSFFCDPTCYDMHCKERSEAASAAAAKARRRRKPAATSTAAYQVQPLNPEAMKHLRAAWHAKAAPLRKYLNRQGPPLAAAAAEPDEDAFSTGSYVYLGD